MKKKLTIIITNYNNDKYISKCIRSISNQKKYFSKIDLIIIDDIQKEIQKTKEMNKILVKFEAKSSIIIADIKSRNNIIKSIRNIPNVKITDVNHFSAYDLAKFKKIIFTETSIKELEKRY